MQYSANEVIDERRTDRNNYEYDNRLKPEYEEHHEQRMKSDYEEHQPPPQSRRMPVQHNVERVRLEIIINFGLKLSEITFK